PPPTGVHTFALPPRVLPFFFALPTTPQGGEKVLNQGAGGLGRDRMLGCDRCSALSVRRRAMKRAARARRWMTGGTAGRCRGCFVIGEPSQWQAMTLGYKGRLLVDYTLCHDMSHSAGQLASGPEIAVEFWNTLTRHATTYNAGLAVFDTLDTSLRAMQTSSDGLQEVVTQRIGLRLPLDYDIEALQTYLLAQAGEATL